MHVAPSSEQIPICGPQDIVLVRGIARAMAAELKFSLADQTRLATAVSELARNVIQYAKKGFCQLNDMSDQNTIRICITIEDNGPGIADLELAMKDGYSTSNGLGAGLPGTRRLMDSFSIESMPGLTRIQIMLAKDRAR